MDNNTFDYYNSTQKRIASEKLFLLICAGVVAFCDFVLFVVSAVAGYGVAVLIFPIIMLIADALFITAICFTNFRFKYSIGVWVSYLAVSVFFTIIMLAVNGGFAGYSVLTNISVLLCVLSHIVLWGGIVFCALASKSKQSFRKKLLSIIVVSVVGLMVLTYTFFVAVNGYYGQGEDNEYRAVLYSYDEKSDGYIASGVADGRGSKVVIPTTFNDKKVVGISAKMFCNTQLKNIDIEGQQMLNIVDTDSVKNINAELMLGVDKSVVDSYREVLFGCENKLISLANNTYPTGLDSDEVYVTFKYSQESYEIAGKQILPTWIGTKGQTFDLKAYSGYDYIENSDKSDDGDLYWASTSNDGYILKDIVSNSVAVGEKIENSTQAEVLFERVYTISIVDDNDTKYEPSLDFKSTTIDGKTYEYRYVTQSSADALLKELSREGFSLSWQTEKNGNIINVYNFAGVLSNNFSDTNEIVELKPVWTLNAPAISNISSNSQLNKFVYGDVVELSANVKAPVDGYNLAYQWQKDDVQVSLTDNCLLSKALPSHSGTYTLQVTASSEATSLTSFATASIDINVDKKTIGFVWSVDGYEYDGNYHTLSCQYNQSDLVEGDNLNYAFALVEGNFGEDNSKVINAGSYKAKVELKGESADYYKVDNTEYYQFRIMPKTVSVDWLGEKTFTYNGQIQRPQAQAMDIYNKPLQLTYSNDYINAGKYTISVSQADSNYVLDNYMCEYDILPRNITLQWSDEVFIYNGNAQYPKLSISNQVEGDEAGDILALTGDTDAVNAGNDYKIEVIIVNNNYSILNTADKEKTFSINKKDMSLVWEESYTFEYNGTSQIAKVTDVAGVLDSEKTFVISNIVYSGSNINAGSYVSTASLSQNIINYNLTGDVDKEFVINKKELTIKAVAENKIYDGEAGGKFSSQIIGLVAKDEGLLTNPEFSGSATTAVNAGNYTLSVRYTSDVLANYIVGYEDCEFIISPKELTIKAVAQNKVYDGEVGGEFSIQIIGLVAKDSGLLTSPEFSGSATTALNAGKYTLSVKYTSDVLANYIVSYEDCEFIISPKELTIKAVAQNKVYDGEAGGEFSTQIIGLVVKDEGLLINPEFSGSATTAVNAGNYRLSVKYTSDVLDNYNVKYTDCEFVISPKKIELVWTEKSFDEDGMAHAPQVVISGQEYEGDIAIKYVYTNLQGDVLSDKPIEAGEYFVEAVITSTNYVFSNTKVQFVINAQVEEV